MANDFFSKINDKLLKNDKIDKIYFEQYSDLLDGCDLRMILPLKMVINVSPFINTFSPILFPSGGFVCKKSNLIKLWTNKLTSIKQLILHMISDPSFPFPQPPSCYFFF
jgi:hypothetical protein